MAGNTAVPTLEEIKTWGATVNVPTACKPLGISTAHGYALLARGEFPAKTLHVGGCWRVVTASLARLLDDDPSH